MIPKRRFANNADLLSTLRAAPDVISKYHICAVQSHQDASVEFDKLPFSEKLHARCIKMTTSHLQNHSNNEDSESTPSSSSSLRHLPVAIFLGSHHVSSNYIPLLRDAINVRRHRAFLQTKYNWTDAIMETIAWDAFSLCGHRVRNDKASTRSKLVHNWLNLGAQRAQHGTGQSVTLRACPYCALPEDFIHLLSCRSPRAMISRFDAVTNLKKALGNNAGNMSIFRAITQWTLNPTVNPTLPSCVPSFQTAIDRAVKSQSAIGWPHLFRGLISASWGTAVTDSTLRFTSLADSPSSATTNNFLAGTIRALQDYSLAIWKSRNDALHQNNELSNAILLANLHHEITTMYSIKDKFSPIIQSYFSMPLEVRPLRPLRQRHRWLRLVRLATSHATAKGSKQQVMSSYFPHATTIPDTAPLATAVTVILQSVPLVSQQVPIRQYYTTTACDTTITPFSD